MHTVTIELLRAGESNDHSLCKRTRYVAICGTNPPVDLRVNCKQKKFNKYKQKLRYDTDEKSRQEGIEFFGQLMKELFDGIVHFLHKDLIKDWLHLRLVMTPRELVQLPFELALTPKGYQGEGSKYLLLNPQRLTTLTREVRQAASSGYEWPYIPRILYAWAEPEGEVPHAQHQSMLVDIVRYFADPMRNNIEPVPDSGQFITIIENASLKSINEAIKSAIKKKPYTHIHILAHGKDVSSKYEDYRLVLHENDHPENSHYVSGEELAQAIIETENDKTFIPAVVSLMACDSSNAGSISLPAGSIAHQLHESGIPCVFASQFPLTIDGSVKLVSTLYRRLLTEGEDPRKALYYTRKDLFDSGVHDWASLVAYVRFPEDIEEQLKDNRLKIVLESMKTANKWAEQVLKYKDKIDLAKKIACFEELNDRLKKSIDDLSNLLDQLKKGTGDEKKRYAENCGLLASGYKRKAEHLFRMADLKQDVAIQLLGESEEALISSRRCYLEGYRGQKNHWTAVQYLSLQAILEKEKKITSDEDKDIWTVAKVFAEDDLLQSEDFVKKLWACGSLAELYLLKPLTLSENHPDFNKEKKASMEKALNYLTLIANAKSSFPTADKELQESIAFARESTHIQFERYIFWWPVMMKSATTNLLKEMVTNLLKDFKL